MAKSGHGVVAAVLAGGEGKRLWPLSRERAKPAIPFGGQYRLIDFVLTNLVHSQVLRMHVLTQYQSYSLIRHLSQGWTFSAHLGQFCQIIPAMSGEGRGWYRGSADALFKCLPQLIRENPKHVAVFGADHVYRMDIRQMVDAHEASGADVTVAVVPQPASEVHRFGCMQTDASGRIVEFFEKPQTLPDFARNSDQILVSMGNYLFNREALREVLIEDQQDPDSRHDVGGNVVPRLLKNLNVHAYDLAKNEVPGMTEPERAYWRDVGTLEAYWESSMDLVSVSPVFNLFNTQWPILTARSDNPPAKFVFADRKSNRLGIATDSIVCGGCIISGGHIDRCILGPRVRVNSFVQMEESIAFEAVEIGRRCKIRRTILDKEVSVPPDTKIGFDEEADRERGIHVSETGIRVLPRGFSFPGT